MRSVLFYTVGYPGTGKTTFARGLAAWLNGVHLRGDQIGIELFRFPTFSPQEKAMVYQEMQNRAVDALRAGRHVLYDASVNTRAQRDQLFALAQTQQAAAVGLHIYVPADLAKQRAGKARDVGVGQPVARIIPPHIFDHLVASFEAPHRDESVVDIAGDVPFYIQYRRLTRSLARHPNAALPRLVSA